MTTEQELVRAEQVADSLLEGRMSSDECPHLSQLVKEAQSGEISRNDFISIIDLHLKENRNLEKLNNDVF